MLVRRYRTIELEMFVFVSSSAQAKRSAPELIIKYRVIRLWRVIEQIRMLHSRCRHKYLRFNFTRPAAELRVRPNFVRRDSLRIRFEGTKVRTN